MKKLIAIGVAVLLSANANAQSATTHADLVAGDALKIIFLGCKFSDVETLAFVNKIPGEKQWSADRTQGWVDDPIVGLKFYLLDQLGLDSQVTVNGWQEINSTASYGDDSGAFGFDLTTIKNDCLAAHSEVEAADFDIRIWMFNHTISNATGGGGEVTLGNKWVGPRTVMHEILHAILVPRLQLLPLFHSNLADLDLYTLSLGYANHYSVMYGNGSYSPLDRSDEHPEYGAIISPMTTANRWMANVVPSEYICEVPKGETFHRLRTWGSPGTECLILTIPQADGKILTIELQPTPSPFQQVKLDFLRDIEPRYLVGVKFPTYVDPNLTDWAMIFDLSKHEGEPGEVFQDALFQQGQNLEIGDANIFFGWEEISGGDEVFKDGFESASQHVRIIR